LDIRNWITFGARGSLPRVLIEKSSSLSQCSLCLISSIGAIYKELIILVQDLDREIPDQVECITAPYIKVPPGEFLLDLFASLSFSRLYIAKTLLGQINSAFPVYEGEIPQNWTSSAGGSMQWARSESDPFPKEVAKFMALT
jgi:hypothetical protein